MPHESPYAPVKIPERPYHELLLDAIDKTIAEGKNKIAFISGDNPNYTLSYEQLRKDAFAIAMYLHSIGFKVSYSHRENFKFSTFWSKAEFSSLKSYRDTGGGKFEKGKDNFEEAYLKH